MREEPPQQRQEPTEDEYQWLYRSCAASDHGDLMIFESEQWVREMGSDDWTPYIASVHGMLEKIGFNELLTEDSEPQCWWDPVASVGFLYHYRPEMKRLLLLRPVRRQPRHGDRLTCEISREDFGAIGDELDLRRLAARAYPYYMTADRDVWLRIENSTEANLALSPEEADLLAHARGLKEDVHWPLFINGRAGSGKSTILQYLFADFVELSLSQAGAIQPLYLTYSRDLLDRARGTVREVLNAHHARLAEAEDSDTGQQDEQERVLGQAFWVFPDLVRSLLPEDRRERYVPEKWIDYARFKRLWQDKFGRSGERTRSPDLVWHAIRTFIKGYAEEDLDPEEYGVLPRAAKSLLPETYRSIYETEWKWYQDLQNSEGYWDNQDLVIEALEYGEFEHLYGAVFCDEAQDFTRIELELIFRLSLFSRRVLTPDELRRLPIAFAGDPLQTVNPTGFRWEAVRSDFREKFEAILDPRLEEQVAADPVCYRELAFNYRSEPGIVRFCNLVQCLRAALLGDKTLRPQQPWRRRGDVVQPGVVAIENAGVLHELQEKTHAAVKIVPCEMDEEAVFAAEDEVLRGTVTEGVPTNVFSPMRAKGLEWKEAVLYRFASAVPGALRGIPDEDPALDSPEASIPVEYFLNRLYVAASRARSRLAIVDANEQIEAFWNFALDPETSDWLERKLGQLAFSHWKDHLGFLQPQATMGGGSAVAAAELARQYEEQAGRERSSYWYRQAALQFTSSGDTGAANRCLGWAERLEGNWRAAGLKFEAASELDAAIDCFWAGAEFQSLDELVRCQTSFGTSPRCVAARAMVAMPFDWQVLTGPLEAALGDGEAITALDSTWSKVAEKFVRAAGARDAPAALPADAWKRVLGVVEKLPNRGLPVADRTRALFLFRAGRAKEAAQLMRERGLTTEDLYFEAKAAASAYPERLVWWAKLGKDRDVLRDWRANGDHASALSEQQAAAVADAALRTGALDEATDVAREHPGAGLGDRVARAALAHRKLETAAGLLDAGTSADVAYKVFDAAMEEKKREVLGAAMRALARHFEAGKRWEELAGLVDSRWRRAPARFKTLADAPWAEDAQRELRAEVVRLLATSDAFSRARDRDALTFWLRKTFVERHHGVPGVSVKEVGAAIERGGIHDDAVRYYEGVGKDGAVSASDKRFAAERLVKSLERFAAYKEKQSRTRDAKRMRDQASVLRRDHGIGPKTLPLYPPEVRGEAPAPVRTVGDQALLDGLSVTVDAERKRIRVVDAEANEALSVYPETGRVLGEIDIEELDEPGAWRVVPWDLRIVISGERVGFFRGAQQCDVVWPVSVTKN
jgi:hypothetical protein